MNCFFVGEGFAEVVVGGGTDLLKAFFFLAEWFMVDDVFAATSCPVRAPL